MRTAFILVLVCGLGPKTSGQDVKRIYDRHDWLLSHGGPGSIVGFLDSIRHTKRTSDADLLLRVLEADRTWRQGNIGQAYARIDSVSAHINEASGVVRYAHAMEVALVLKALSAYDKAEPYALQAFHFAQAFDLGPYQAEALSLLSELHRHRGAYDLALGRLIEAERIATASGFNDVLCGILNNKGGLAHSRGRHQDALAMFKEAHTCAVENGMHVLALRSLANMGAIWYQLDSMDLALNTYRLALSSADPVDDARFVAQVSGNVGLMLIEMEAYADAEKELSQALQGRSAVRDTVGMLDMHLYLAELYHSTGRIPMAIDHAERARALSEGANAMERLQESELKLYELKEGIGDHRGALGHLRAQQQLRQRLDSLAMGETTLRIEVAYETEKKEQALLLSEEQRHAERARRNWLIVLAFLLTGLAALLFRNYRVQRRLRAQEHALHTREVSDLLKQQEINSLESMMKGQERERERVGRDLHDRIGSMLSSVKLQFSALEGRLTKLQDTQRTQYDKLTGLLDETVAEVRRISHDMVRGTLADFGLLRALQDLGEALTAPGKLRVEMSAFGMEDRLAPPFEIGVYRMVQECVSNVLRHAKATELTIQLTRSGSALNVLVEDNGTGFDADQLKAGLGLRNIKERAAALGGTASIDSALGRGTTVSIDLPLA